jgi:integrase
VHHYHTVLSAVLQKAVAWKHIDANPARGAKLPKLKPVREQHVLTYTQAQSLLGALCLRVRTAVALALSTGARRGELFAVRWKHVDSESRTLSIEQSVYDGVIDSPKTENSVRDIPLHPSIVQLLLEWKSKSKYSKPEHFIFAVHDGNVPGDPYRMLRSHITPACGEVEIPRSTWMTFRRTWATWADGKGITPKMRGELMGNSAEVNERIYTKVLPDSLRFAVDVVGGELFSNCSVTTETVNCG